MSDEMLKRLAENIDCGVTVEEAWRSNFRARYDIEQSLFNIKYSYNPITGQRVTSMWSLPDEERETLRDEANTCWDKIEPLIKAYQKTDGPGIYEITISWNRVGWIDALNKESALRQADTIFNWLSSVKSPDNPRLSKLAVRLMYDSDPVLLSKKNKELIESTIAGIDDAKKRIIAEQVRMRWLTAVSAVLPVTGTE
jgi:hypothetical protein